MREFDDQLLRLKQVLRVTEDQAVAATLGMAKAAFAERKRRNAFPADKLKALAADRPELKLDVKYVLTGVSDELERRLDAIKRTTELSVRLYPDDRVRGVLVRDVLLGAEFGSCEIIDQAIETYMATRQAKPPRKGKK